MNSDKRYERHQEGREIFAGRRADYRLPRTIRDELLDREVTRIVRIENKSRRDAAFTNPDPVYGDDRSYAPMIAGGRRVPVRYE